MPRIPDRQEVRRDIEAAERELERLEGQVIAFFDGISAGRLGPLIREHMLERGLEVPDPLLPTETAPKDRRA